MKNKMSPEAGIVFTPEERESWKAAGYTNEDLDEMEIDSRSTPWNDVVDENGRPLFEDEIDENL